MLQMEHIFKAFPGVIALKDVTFSAQRGTVHALIGENGAGKSTLMKILSGVYQADDGQIYVDGELVQINNPKDAMRYGISMIYQELNEVPEMTIAENIFLGREPKTKLGLVDFKKMVADAQTLFDMFGFPHAPRARMKTLSVANMQMVEIMKAVSREARMIVMDEPTSSITDKEVAVLFDCIRRLKQDGVTIIYISHRMEELEQIADYVTVLRDGETIDTRLMRDVTQDEIVRMMVGRTLKNYFTKNEVPRGAKVLEVRGLTRKGVFQDVSFDVYAGEILGFAGLIGAGRTETMRAIFGLDAYDSGVLTLDGAQLRIKNVRDAIRNGIAMVPEDRKGLGAVLARPVSENMTLPHLKQYRSFCLRRQQETQDVTRQIQRFRIKVASPHNPMSSLSGGNQQKVLLGKWLLRMPRVLILDEPTRGIDVGAKAEIYKYMCELAAEGIATIMVSSEMPEVLSMSDRILVMAGGRITGEMQRENADSETVLRYAMEGVT